MKTVYLWNDLDLFFDFPLKEVSAAIDAFANGTSNCTLFGSGEFVSWAARIKADGAEKGFLVGTRPNRLKLANLQGFSSLRPRRVHQTSGTTATVTLPDEQRIELTGALNKNTGICIVEDVVVGGKTMESLCEIVRASSSTKTTRFRFFVANRQSLEALQENFSHVAEFHAHHLMEGRPIKESTLICLYDLLFNDLGDRPFRERNDLLSRFFSDLDGLAHLVSQCRDQLAERRCER